MSLGFNQGQTTSFGDFDISSPFYTTASNNNSNINNNILDFNSWQKQNNGGWSEYGIYLNQLGFLGGNYSDPFLEKIGSQLGSIPLAEQQKFYNTINPNLHSYMADSEKFRNSYSNATNKLYGIQKTPDNNKQTATDATNQWLNYLGGGVNIGTSIANTVLGYKNFEQNKKLINKQIDAVNEQIEASREYRQQRRDEIARLNKVRSNTSKAFNTGSVITRSY